VRGAGIVALGLAGCLSGCLSAPPSRVDGTVLLTGDDAVRFALPAPLRGATRFSLESGRAWAVEDHPDQLMIVLADGPRQPCSAPVVSLPDGGVSVVLTGRGAAGGFSEAIYATGESGPPGVVSFLRDVELEARVEPANPEDPPDIDGRVVGRAAFGYYQEPEARAHPVIPSPGLHNQRLRFDVPLCGRL
jgi:hypothetical protein